MSLEFEIFALKENSLSILQAGKAFIEHEQHFEKAGGRYVNCANDTSIKLKRPLLGKPRIQFEAEYLENLDFPRFLTFWASHGPIAVALDDFEDSNPLIFASNELTEKYEEAFDIATLPALSDPTANDEDFESEKYLPFFDFVAGPSEDEIVVNPKPVAGSSFPFIVPDGSAVLNKDFNLRLTFADDNLTSPEAIFFSISGMERLEKIICPDHTVHMSISERKTVQLNELSTLFYLSVIEYDQAYRCGFDVNVSLMGTEAQLKTVLQLFYTKIRSLNPESVLEKIAVGANNENMVSRFQPLVFDEKSSSYIHGSEPEILYEWPDFD